jgi:hypothetical protein
MYIIESLGTPNTLLNLLNRNKSSIQNIVSNKSDTTLTLNINEPDLVCNLEVEFQFLNTNNYPGNINYKECVLSNFQNCKILLVIPSKNTDIKIVFKTLLHELNHLYELYQIKSIFSKTKWFRTDGLIKFNKQIESNNLRLIRYFSDLYYISLPNEINSRISSLYIYLDSINSHD